MFSEENYALVITIYGWFKSATNGSTFIDSALVFPKLGDGSEYKLDGSGRGEINYS